MAIAVKKAMENRRHLIAEAGTGTGKTFAYLIPAILSGQKVIISTGTKNLQDQLFNKDLPVIRDVLITPFQAALLKGRANYLCRYRLANGRGGICEHLAGCQRGHFTRAPRVTLPVKLEPRNRDRYF